MASTFSKRHYEAIAQDLKTEMLRHAHTQTPDDALCHRDALYQLAAVMADRFVKDNPHFKRDKFMLAAGF